MIATASTAPSNLKADYNFGYIWLISIVAALGGLLFGYDWVVIGGAKPFFERYFILTNAAQSGWANSCALIGCLVGALVAGALSDKFGRKRLLIVSAFLFAVDFHRQCACTNILLFLSAGGFSVAWPLAWRRIFRRCISQKSRRHRCAANSFPSIN